MRELALLACGFVAACNFDTGECYPRGEEGAGAGGGAITPTGAGGFGDVPPKPQGGPSPVDPCLQKAECTVIWKADSTVCKGQGTSGACTTSYEGNHSTLSEAQSECARVNGVGSSSGAESCGSCEWVTNASSSCGEKYQDCVNYGPTSCLAVEAGKSLCNRCLERCNAGDSPSAKCRKCKF